MKNTIKIILSILALYACDGAEIQPNSSGDYFPLKDGQQWSYQRWIDFSSDDPVKTSFDTLTLLVSGDTVVEGKTYRVITDGYGNIDKIVRRSGVQYFGRHHEFYGTFSHEYIFLDLSKAPGQSWSYVKDEGLTKTEYVIVSKNGKQTFLGIEYDNVVEVKVNYYNLSSSGDFELWVSALHYYAEGIGEIYHYYPYPVSFTYGDITGYIMKQ
jgi:hypothetical protein